MPNQRARGRFVVFLALLLLMPALPASAAEVSTDCAGLQAALIAANDGDVITITEASCGPDSYTMKTGAQITLQGAEGTGTTFLGGDPATRILSGLDVGESVFRNLTFRDATTPDNGAGVALTGTVTPLFDGVSFVGNTAADGGGLFITSTSNTGSIRIRNSLFEDNRANDDGGGVFIGAGSGAEIEVQSNTFVTNSTHERGGGFYLWGLDTAITGNSVTENASGQQGGGGWAAINHEQAAIARNTFSQNRIDPEAGASGGVYGGGLYLTATGGSSVAQEGNVFDRNRISTASLGPGFGGAGEYIGLLPNVVISVPEIFITRDRFTNNVAVDPSDSADVDGGGLGLTGAEVVMWNAVVAGNSIEGGEGEGAGIYAGAIVGTPTTLELVHTTVAGNVTTVGTGGIAGDAQDSLTLRNSIVAGNTGSTPDITGFGSVDAQFTDSCTGIGLTGTPLPGTGNICANPLLQNPGPGPADVHQTAASPTRDAGSNALVPAGLTTDFEGDPRIMDSNADGAAVADMGADEILQALVVQPPAQPPAAQPPLQQAAAARGRIPATGPEDIMPQSLAALSYLLLGLLFILVTTSKWEGAWRATSYAPGHARGRRYKPRHKAGTG